MRSEIDIYGIFFPSLLVLMFATFLISLPIRRLLSWTGAYRLVWHRGLFDAAIYILLLGAVASATNWLFT